MDEDLLIPETFTVRDNTNTDDDAEDVASVDSLLINMCVE